VNFESYSIAIHREQVFESNWLHLDNFVPGLCSAIFMGISEAIPDFFAT
jgi:hypothetical protein